MVPQFTPRPSTFIITPKNKIYIIGHKPLDIFFGKNWNINTSRRQKIEFLYSRWRVFSRKNFGFSRKRRQVKKKGQKRLFFSFFV